MATVVSSYPNAKDPSSPLDIRPIGGRIGAEIRGVVLSGDLDAGTVQAIEAALVRHKVIFFRGQDHLDNAAHEAFASLFSDPVAHPTVQVAEGSRYLLELDSREGYAASSWHTDVTFVDAYRTVMAGKWHLGVAAGKDPHDRGFDRSFALLQGGANHFGADLNPDPTARGAATYSENGQHLTRLPERFYSSDAYADKLLAELRESRAGRGAKKPFFAYLTFTAPHWPLQATAEGVARYRGHYDAGFDVLRRLAAVQPRRRSGRDHQSERRAA